MTDTAATRDDALESARWDLSHLTDGGGEAEARALMERAVERAEAFAEARRGSVAGLGAAELAAAMRELEEITDLAGRAASFAHLRFAADTEPPEHGALLQWAREQGARIQAALLFFELEWIAVPDERADELLADPELERWEHHLRSERRYRPHVLSEPEERVMTEKRVTGRDAFSRLFDELDSATRAELDGEQVPLQLALSRLHVPERAARRAAAESVTAALEPQLRTRAYVFNTLLADKATDDRLRDYPSWISSRNLANEASDESVEALVAAVRDRYDIPQRWYRLKARLLGLPALADYDRVAPLPRDEAEVPYADAREIVTSSYRAFSGELGALVERFFAEGWIDAPPSPGKRGGAFCAPTVPSVHPYVLLNYTAMRRDVLTVAHELGHGVHQALAASRGPFGQSTPLTVAETASVFGEELVLSRLLEEVGDDRARLALLGETLDDMVATVFRQVAMNRFEHLVHTGRRERGELSVEAICDLWAQAQGELFGDSVEMSGGYRTWWSYIPHFVHTPGYVYAYAYGQLLALSVFHRWREEGDAFVPRYLDMLRAGGSRPPAELAAIVGCDLEDPGFWAQGLRLVEERLEEAEALAEAGAAG